MKPYLKVTLAYAVFGAAWIFFSDRLVELISENMAGATYFQTVKGWLFVALSSLLVLAITRRSFEAQARGEVEKLAVFNKTVEGAYHILLNYLNQMQLVALEAERCDGFDRDVLRVANEASDEAAGELKKLGEVRSVTAEQIDSVIYRSLRKTGSGAEHAG